MINIYESLVNITLLIYKSLRVKQRKLEAMF